MDKTREIKIKSRRDYVMEFSKKTGITDDKVDTFLKMEEKVNISHNAFILGQERNQWEGTTYGVDYGTHLGAVFSRFNEDNVVKAYYEGDWSYAESNNEYSKFIPVAHKKDIPCRPRGKIRLIDITPL